MSVKRTNTCSSRWNWSAANDGQVRILDHRGESPLAQLYPLAQLGAARAAAAAGDNAKAREAYDLFLTIWREADPEVPLLREARLERERLKS